MTGMEMMLKTMGFDPAKIKAEVEQFAATLRQTLTNFDMRLKAIEEAQKRIEEKLGTQTNGPGNGDTGSTKRIGA
jgi:hypothetical protein